VKQELGSVIDKYAQRPTDAQVVFSKIAHEYVCEAVVHLSTGLTAQASARATRSMPPSTNAPRRWTSSSVATSAA
jgi:ribosome-associated translation inhibitor RaiA